uniref:Uncharacterized protein n=1 Tax=mine drainage metagenome TaxID=410659 RepID=E6QVR8_9ZZZZ
MGLGYVGYDTAENAVDYAISVLASDWPQQVRDLEAKTSS